MAPSRIAGDTRSIDGQFCTGQILRVRPLSRGRGMLKVTNEPYLVTGSACYDGDG
jgi:hypothetical protein